MDEYRFIGVVPFAHDEEKHLRFLLGREWLGHTSDPGLWGVFGGSPDSSDKSLYHGAARECYEESLGFLGTQEEILRRLLKSRRAFYTEKGVIFPLHIRFDRELPEVYKRVYNYCSECTGWPEGFFEKTDIAWFKDEDIIGSQERFRPKFMEFYNEFLSH